MRVTSIVMALGLLSGCATTSVTEFQSPDGTRVKAVKCVSDPQKCYVEASKSCPDGGTYRVLSSESHAGGMLADLMPGPVTWYGMTYACGSSDGQMADFQFRGSKFVPIPAPVVVQQPAIRPSPTTTTCNSRGGTVTCNTY